MHPPSHPADLTNLTLDSALGFDGAYHDGWWRFIRDNDKGPYSEFLVTPWDPTWPDDFLAFGKKLAEPSTVATDARFSVMEQSRAPDEWLYVGVMVTELRTLPSFVLVRMVAGARFYCTPDFIEVDTYEGLRAAIDACRALKL